MKRTDFTDPLGRNIGYLSVLVFVLSLQVLIVLVFIYQFIPMTMAPITAGVPPTLLKLFHPNRNHLFYHAFIATALCGQALVLCVFRKQLALPELAGEIQEFLVCETVWVSWQLFAVFKILQYNNPGWARILLYTGFAAALLAKIFWPELKRGLKSFQVCLRGEIPVHWRYVADGLMVLILLLTIAIPDTQKALIRMAVGDNNNHFDQWLMAPLWAYHKGLTIASQFFDPLNWGALVLVHTLVSFMGGVTYGHVVSVLCFLAMVYFTAFYYFLRFWTGILPAAFGVLLAIKLQMFNAGISPLIWVFPGQGVLRHLFDVMVFFCLLKFARGQGKSFIWLAAIAVGISMSFVFDTGVYMLGALYAYIAVLMSFKDTRCLLCPNPRQWRKVLGLIFLPWFSMVVALVSCFGPVASHREFWANSFINIPQWLNGFESVSIYSCLRDRNFFAFFASFVPPVIYTMGSMAAIMMVCARRWGHEKLLLIPMGVYGLGVYAHFLWHGTINFYYMVPLPLVGCICFWGTQYLNGLIKIRQRRIKLILVLGAGIALFSNYFFTYYPNVFNMAGEDWGQEKAYYGANYNFKKDADFVRHWTSPRQRVALISVFETQILMQADRTSLFYESLTMINHTDIQQLADQLDKYKPQQVFVYKNILNITGNTVFAPLTDNLKAHYQYSGQQSDGLALMQRNHE